MNQEVVLGIDLGGTNTKAGLVDKNGKVLAFERFNTHAKEEFPIFLEHLSIVFNRISGPFKDQISIKGVGIGAPNVNFYTGNMERAHNFSWGEITPLAPAIHEKLNLPVVATNDANVAALGEMVFGIAREMKNFAVLTLGTGLGSGIVVDRKLLLGQDGLAGEMGHVNVRPDGRNCNCGLSGCLETYVSVTGIKRTVFKLMADRKVDSILRGYNYHELDGEMIAQAALDGDPIAKEAFTYTGNILGTKLADLVAYFNPEAVILTGGLTHARDLLLVPTQESMDARLFPAFRGKVRLLLSSVGGAHDAVLGAAALAWQHL
ncbi:MAG: ROK family protein [Lewinellaceae bacterium]|nr:ROK family protein [Lewinella sp.]MCB9277719.1 ROK family protein [Lewinellaceae bacterium]